MRDLILQLSKSSIYSTKPYKAKNLFVKFPDAEPMTKNALRFYWETLYNPNNDIEWLNPAECRDVGIPLGDLRDAIIEKFNISDSESLEGAAIIFAVVVTGIKIKLKG